jgi:ribosome-associated translation inhibitor RaiA
MLKIQISSGCPRTLMKDALAYGVLPRLCLKKRFGAFPVKAHVIGESLIVFFCNHYYDSTHARRLPGIYRIKGDSMGNAEFYIDYNIEVPAIGEGFKRETEQRLQELASAHSDVVGAAVALEKVVDTTTYDVYRVRIVIYKRPTDIAVDKKDPDPLVALRDALDALEEQVRESREKLAQHNTHRDSQIETVYYDLSADEIYATYAEGWPPEEILEMDHTQLASRLMQENGLTQDAADFAADQILLVAERNSDQGK